MSTTTFTRYIATTDYDRYLVCIAHEVTHEQAKMLNDWRKSWTKDQCKWIFNHFAIGDDGRLSKLQGMDIRPYLADIALQLSMVKGHSVLTGYDMSSEQLELPMS
jgi:hypothetical protein